jgi:PBSX family phage terminase large subunit
MIITDKPPLSPKQLLFTKFATRKWNIAHGPVRSGKTNGSLFAFMCAVEQCPDSSIWMIGHTVSTIYDNAIRLLFESEQFAIFRPFCTWLKGERELKFRDKTIGVLGAKDEGAIGAFTGKTMSLAYADEITLYPDSIINMLDTRLSNPWSKGFATCNPSYPTHIVKKWIDKAAAGDKNYYALQFMLEDNPYLEESYKERIRNSLSGVFYKRNYLGLWCLAEGAIFDFFDRDIYVVKKPPRAAEYWIAAIDYGSIHPFVCLLIGVSTGRYTQSGKCLWVEKEYFWDSRVKGKQKTQSEYADDVQEFLAPYGVRQIYIDPSAEAFHHELRIRNMHVVHANNDVENGLAYTCSEMQQGNLFICAECTNTVRQIEGYVWDSNAAKKGEDKPVKVEDDAVDAMRYAVYSHKVATYDPYTHNPNDWLRDKYRPTR